MQDGCNQWLRSSARCRRGARHTAQSAPASAVPFSTHHSTARCGTATRASPQDILAPLLHVNELRKHGVTLHMLLDAERQPIPDVPAIYFVQPTEAAVARIVQDVARGLYDAFHLNFSTHIPRPLMEKLAAGTRVAEGHTAATCSFGVAAVPAPAN